MSIEQKVAVITGAPPGIAQRATKAIARIMSFRALAWRSIGAPDIATPVARFGMPRRLKRPTNEHVLLHELNHRINNEFAAAISVVSAAAARSSDQDVKAALTGVRELLHRYADLHRALQMPDNDGALDAAAYLQRLCESISRSKLEDRDIKLVLSAQSLRLRADRCWRLGLILYELITNAARHAFDGGGGEIWVALRSDGSFIRCTVQDNGSTPARIQPGHGLKIVDELSNALGGRFTVRFGSNGWRSLLVLPADNEPR